MIELLPLQNSQAAIFHRWISDPEVIAYSLTAFQSLTSVEQVAEWLAHTLLDQRSLTLGIYLAETKELIGYAGIVNISRINQSGEYFEVVQLRWTV